MYNKIFDAKTGTREEWLAVRKQGIGGSDMAAVLGYNDRRSALNVWLEKRDEKPCVEETLRPTGPTSAMYFGVLNEASVAKAFEDETGLKVRRNNYTLQSIEYPYLLANIDREIVGIDAGLECKTTTAYNAKAWEGDMVPDAYYIQCQHYMAVTGKQSWWIACLCDNHKFIHKKVTRNEETIQMIITEGAKFWQMVQDGTMPAVDGSSACTDALKQMYPESNGEQIELEESAKIYIDDYMRAKADEEEAIERQTKAKNILISMLGNNEKGIAGSYTVAYKTAAGIKRFDTKRFQKEKPELYKAYIKQGAPSRKFSIK